MPKTRRNGRGSATKGWKNQKPSYRERSVMLKKCVKKFFLGTQKSFPICKKNTCKVSPKGVYSAYIRARQYSSKGQKYRIVSKKANRILVNMGEKR